MLTTVHHKITFFSKKETRSRDRAKKVQIDLRNKRRLPQDAAEVVKSDDVDPVQPGAPQAAALEVGRG